MFKNNLSLLFQTFSLSTLFFSCAAEQQVSQDEFIKKAQKEANPLKNTLLATAKGTCDSSINNTATVRVTNNDSTRISCEVKEYDFLHTKINIEHPVEHKFSVEPDRSSGIGITFEKNFPKHGVVMSVVCHTQDKIFKDVVLITCKG